MNELKEEDRRDLVTLFEELLSEAKAGRISACALTVIRVNGTIRFSKTGVDANLIQLLGAVEMLKSVIQRRVNLDPTKEGA